MDEPAVYLEMYKFDFDVKDFLVRQSDPTFRVVDNAIDSLQSLHFISVANIRLRWRIVILPKRLAYVMLVAGRNVSMWWLIEIYLSNEMYIFYISKWRPFSYLCNFRFFFLHVTKLPLSEITSNKVRIFFHERLFNSRDELVEDFLLYCEKKMSKTLHAQQGIDLFFKLRTQQTLAIIISIAYKSINKTRNTVLIFSYINEMLQTSINTLAAIFQHKCTVFNNSRQVRLPHDLH